MRIFDPHAHMTSRTTEDYEKMKAAGVDAIVEPAFWLGQPRTNVGSFTDYFDSLLGWEPFRASRFGIIYHCTIALNPKEANDRGLQRDVLEVLPRYLAKDGVVAVGEVGYDAVTPEEDEAFQAQLEMAIEHDLPVMVHTPHRDKAAGTKRSLDVVRDSGIDPSRVIIDHNNELTVEMVLESGCWAAFSVYPDTKMDEDRMARILKQYGVEQMLVDSAADWGRSDVLKVPKTVEAAREIGIDDASLQKLVWDNPVEVYAKSGRLDLTPPDADQSASYEGNTVLRGQRPA